MTSGELECPRWAAQSDAPILSSIRASTVSGSGTLIRASARHIRATPSRVDRPYSARKPCMTDVPARARTVRTRPIALSTIVSRSFDPSAAVSILSRTAHASASRMAARMTARISESRHRRVFMAMPPSQAVGCRRFCRNRSASRLLSAAASNCLVSRPIRSAVPSARSATIVAAPQERPARTRGSVVRSHAPQGARPASPERKLAAPHRRINSFGSGERIPGRRAAALPRASAHSGDPLEHPADWPRPNLPAPHRR